MCKLISFVQTESDIIHFPGIDSHTEIQRRGLVTDGMEPLNWLLAVAPDRSVPQGSVRRLVPDPHTQKHVPPWFGQSQGRMAEAFAAKVAAHPECLIGYLAPARTLVDQAYLSRTLVLPVGQPRLPFSEITRWFSGGPTPNYWFCIRLDRLLSCPGFNPELVDLLTNGMVRSGRWANRQEVLTYPHRFAVVVNACEPRMYANPKPYYGALPLSTTTLGPENLGVVARVEDIQLVELYRDEAVVPVTSAISRTMAARTGLQRGSRVFFTSDTRLTNTAIRPTDLHLRDGDVFRGVSVGTERGDIALEVWALPVGHGMVVTYLSDRDLTVEWDEPTPALDFTVWATLFRQKKNRIDEWKDPAQITIDYSNRVFAPAA